MSWGAKTLLRLKRAKLRGSLQLAESSAFLRINGKKCAGCQEIAPRCCFSSYFDSVRCLSSSYQRVAEQEETPNQLSLCAYAVRLFKAGKFTTRPTHFLSLRAASHANVPVWTGIRSPQVAPLECSLLCLAGLFHRSAVQAVAAAAMAFLKLRSLERMPCYAKFLGLGDTNGLWK